MHHKSLEFLLFCLCVFCGLAPIPVNADDFLDQLFLPEHARSNEPDLPRSRIAFGLEFETQVIEEILTRNVPWIVKEPNPDQPTDTPLAVTIHRIGPVSFFADASDPDRRSFKIEMLIGYRLAVRTGAKDVRVGWNGDGLDKEKERVTLRDRPGFRVSIYGRFLLTPDLRVQFILKHVVLEPTNRALLGVPKIEITHKSITVGTQNLDVTPAVQFVAEMMLPPLLLPQFESLSNDLTSKLRQARDKHLPVAVETLRKHWKLPNGFSLNLLVDAIEVTAPRFEQRGRLLALDIAISFSPEVYFGPALKRNPVQLEFRIIDQIVHGVDIRFPILVGLDQLERLAGHTMPEFPIEQKYLKTTLKPKPPKLVICGGRIMARVPFESDVGKLKGTAYLACVPKYDTRSKTLELDQISVKIASQVSNGFFLLGSILDTQASRLEKHIRGLGRISLDRQSLRASEIRSALEKAAVEFGLQVNLTGATLGPQIDDVALFPSRNALGLVVRLRSELQLSSKPIQLATLPARKIKQIFVHYDIYDDNKEEQGGLTLHLTKDGQRELLVRDWGHKQEWVDWTLHRFPEASNDKNAPINLPSPFEGKPVEGEYDLEVDITQGERIDHPVEYYLEIVDQHDGRSISNLRYYYWKDNIKSLPAERRRLVVE